MVRLSDQKPVHHEILVRIRDEDGTYILPGNFIELAESLGLVQEIDMCVVEKLLRFMWENKQFGKKLRYFVNLSRVSISDQRWIKRFEVDYLKIDGGFIRERAASGRKNRPRRSGKRCCRSPLTHHSGYAPAT